MRKTHLTPILGAPQASITLLQNVSRPVPPFLRLPLPFLVISCLEADTNSLADFLTTGLFPPAVLGLPPARPWSPLSWVTLTASFCQPTLRVSRQSHLLKTQM